MTQVPIEQALQVAIAHHQAGRLTEAESIYRQILSVRPDHAEAHHLLGVVASQTGRLDQAVACYQRAIELKGDFPDGLNNLAVAFRAMGRPDQSVLCCQRALKLNPNLVEPHANLALALSDMGQHDQAIVCFQKALSIAPDLAAVHAGLADSLARMHQVDRAVASYQRAIALKPDFVQAHVNFGQLCTEAGLFHQAIVCYQRAIELRPELVKARTNLGMALNQADRFDEAIDCLKLALDFDPDAALAHNNLGMAWMFTGQLDEAIACFHRALALEADLAPANDNLLIALHYHPDSDARSLFEASRSWGRRCAGSLRQFLPPASTSSGWANDRNPDRPLRIGYVSADFRVNVSAFFLLPLLSHHDRQQFEVTCYAQVAHRDEFTRRMRDCVPHWRSTVGLDDSQVASLVREDRIDILVDLKLHTAQNRLLVFAHKPAPIQVTWLGYPGTTGLKAIDYRLTDPYLDPSGLDDAFYCERSIRLPHTFWCYDPILPEPLVNALPCLQTGFVTFGCLNNFCKVNGGVLDLWSRVLAAVPGSRLLVLVPEGSARRSLLDRMAANGVDPARIECAGRHLRPDYLRTYHRIDIALDTFPYNGHTTSLDAFWMGVPVITLAGRTAVGRAGVSQLTNLGLTELIARTPEHYVQIAADLAADRPRLAELRTDLRRRMRSSPLMDGARFSRGVEEAYRAMWRRWCEK